MQFTVFKDSLLELFGVNHSFLAIQYLQLPQEVNITFHSKFRIFHFLSTNSQKSLIGLVIIIGSGHFAILRTNLECLTFLFVVLKDFVPQTTPSGQYEGFDQLVEGANAWIREQKDICLLNMQSILVQKQAGKGFVREP